MIVLDGKERTWHSGMTVSELLREISDAHHYAVIKVNGRYVSRPDFETFLIPDNADVRLIPMIAGG